jgi:hypothetical protein
MFFRRAYSKSKKILFQFAAHAKVSIGLIPSLPKLIVDWGDVNSTLSSKSMAHLVATDGRAPINTFDVFDTLIARRCIEPVRIFDQVGAKMNIPDFTAQRRRAEAAVANAPHTIDDIYRELAKNLGLSDEQAQAIKQAEIEAELENVIPIAEHIARVQDGDLLLSDMYLGEDNIRRLLAKAGFDKNVGLIVTSDGKRSGALWPKLLAQHSIKRHLGDNRHSDVDMPMRFGIACDHTRIATVTDMEALLLKAGLRDLVELVREARLRSWHPDPVVRRLQLIQIYLNFPILLLSSIRLLRLAKEQNISRLLFASRDCNLWLPLARLVAERINIPCAMDYFYTSRKARMQASADYLAYARGFMNAESMIIDICGTGWSLAHFVKTIGLDSYRAFYIHHVRPMAAYERKSPTPANCVVHAIIGPEKEGFSNPRFEMCNYAEHGSVEDVRLIESGARPVFEDDHRPSPVLNMVAEQRTCFTDAIGLMKNATLNATFALNDRIITGIVGTLYGILSKDNVLPGIYMPSHREEDAKAMIEMGLE